jgi:hypothetical protein
MMKAIAVEFEAKDMGHDGWWLLRQADREAKSSGLGGLGALHRKSMRR